MVGLRELALSVFHTTAVGQKALFHGRSIQKHTMSLFNLVICGVTDLIFHVREFLYKEDYEATNFNAKIALIFY